MGDWEGSMMLYTLERRSTSLVMPTLLFNYLQENNIPYDYDFEQGGIQLEECVVERIKELGEDYFVPQPTAVIPVQQKLIKTPNKNKHLHKRRLI